MIATPSLRSHLSAFSSEYSSARERFLDLADHSGCSAQSWSLPGKGPRGESLAVDVARYGDPSAQRWLLLSSGLHGAEGPFGAAVQWAFLNSLQPHSIPRDVGVLFLHGLNPYGFAWQRRVNEDNVDLNRNFLLPGEAYAGSHPLYQHVYRQFDPTQPPSQHESFSLKAWLLIMRHGKSVLQSSLPIGQYDFPKGLFYGGQGPARLASYLREELLSWMPRAQEVIHLDFHTGLGRWATYRLLMDDPHHHPGVQWFAERFPAAHIEVAASNRTAYSARGTLGPWLRRTVFSQLTYRYTTVEFGTYSAVRVIKALFDELRAHYACEPGDPRYQWAKQQMMEAFVPVSPRWRQSVLQQGTEICSRCLSALGTPTHEPAHLVR